ncbi:hypothetical protein FQN50_004790 [Emmonsiellopsis sp. PD_5]|nr:hypothetical protein FQN50_004790 [Emmonsiellopsis sp. PD_5]
MVLVSLLGDLPADVFLVVADHLRAGDLYTLIRVCRSFCSLVIILLRLRALNCRIVNHYEGSRTRHIVHEPADGACPPLAMTILEWAAQRAIRIPTARKLFDLARATGKQLGPPEYRNLFVFAASAGNTQMASLIFDEIHQHEPSIRFPSDEIFPPDRLSLGFAAVRGHIDTVGLLLQHGKIRLNDPKTSIYHILDHIAREGPVNMLKFLVSRGADCTQRSRAGGFTLLHTAAESGQIEMVACLVDEFGLNVNCQDNSNRTPISYAVHSCVDPSHPSRAKMLKTVELLVEKGALVSKPPLSFQIRQPLLHLACKHNDPDLLGILLGAKSVDLHVIDEDHRTPFHCAAAAGASVMKTLFNYGTDYCDSVDKFGQTPLHIAARCKQPEICQMLLNAGADISRRDNLHHKSPLHHAASVGSTACVECLLKAGADVTAVDHNGSTPLHESGWMWSRSASKDVGMILLRAGADISATNNEGLTPLHIFARSSVYCVDEIFQLFLDEGADPAARDNAGWTPFHHAAFWDSKAVSLFLRFYLRSFSSTPEFTPSAYIDRRAWLEEALERKHALILELYE